MRLTVKKLKEGIGLFEARYPYNPLLICLHDSNQVDEWQILHPRMMRYCVYYTQDGEWIENKHFPNARPNGET